MPIELVAMSRPAPPALTVRYDGAARTFAAGNDVVIGRDLRADVRIAHPLISRAHLVLRFDQGRWLAIDNGSLNGMFVHGRRVPTVDIQDGQRLNIGNPDGPELSFDVGRHEGGPATDDVDPGRGPQWGLAHFAAADPSHRRPPARSRTRQVRSRATRRPSSRGTRAARSRAIRGRRHNPPGRPSRCRNRFPNRPFRNRPSSR